jgi:hypothetical protein
MRFTPKKISHLEDGEIFVFGSNLAGIHGAGAAKLAFEEFGAIWGVGVGHEGKTYAIPTKDYNIKTMYLDVINSYVNGFIKYAVKNPDFTFLVTEIGCGLAGYTPRDIAPMFRFYPLNVVLPQNFVDVLREDC